MNQPLAPPRHHAVPPSLAKGLLSFYLLLLAIDPIRKVFGLSGIIISLVYLATLLLYIYLPQLRRSQRAVSLRMLPLWMVLLTAWCLVNALIHHIPLPIALLGWVSYVFFVPFVYFGIAIGSGEKGLIDRALTVMTISGAVIGLGAVAGAILGPSSPSFIAPIVPTVGIHSAAFTTIYLSPSIFASAEQAAEYLLVAFFSWLALARSSTSSSRGRLRPIIVAALIFSGLLATSRRADIWVALAGAAFFMLISVKPASPNSLQHLHSPIRTVLPALFIGGIAGITLLIFLGAGTLLPFLTSLTNARQTLLFMFAPTHPFSLIGQGVGTTTQGISSLGAVAFNSFTTKSQYTGYIINGRVFMGAEGGLTKAWLELGLVGVLLYAAVFTSILGPLLRHLTRINAVGQAMGVLALCLGIVFLKAQASLGDPLVQPMFWLAAGIGLGSIAEDSDIAMPAAQSPVGSLVE